ncbi:MAG TPA: acylphosphatase [Methanothrix sp.]|nr:acylphosphatase [Methanothrix sp.]
MKLKVKISGTRVHEVGYRVFLLKHAMNLALPGLSTYNWEEGGQQEVIALLEGDEARISAFLQTVEKKKPELAEVSKVTIEDYDGDVGRTSEVAMFCSFVQLDKAIPLLLDMRDDLKEMKGDIKAVRKNTDMIPQISEDLKAVRKNTDMIPQISEDINAVRKTTDATLDEIKGMREDIQPGYAMQFRQVQSDVRAIKDRLGMS